MRVDFSQELTRQFDRVSLAREAKKQLNPREWREYQLIKKEHNGHRRHEQKLFEKDYDLRVDAETQRLIKKAGAKTKTLKHRWFGHDNFDKAAIERRAHRQVVFDHRQNLAAIDELENTSVRQLIERCEKRVAQRDKTKNDFNRVSDRRQSGERRDAIQTIAPPPQLTHQRSR